MQPDGDVLPHLRNLAVRSLLSMSRCVNMLITKMDSFVGTIKNHLLDSRGGAQCLVNHLLEPPSPSRSISCPFSVWLKSSRSIKQKYNTTLAAAKISAVRLASCSPSITTRLYRKGASFTMPAQNQDTPEGKKKRAVCAALRELSARFVVLVLKIPSQVSKQLPWGDRATSELSQLRCLLTVFTHVLQ